MQPLFLHALHPGHTAVVRYQGCSIRRFQPHYLLVINADALNYCLNGHKQQSFKPKDNVFCVEATGDIINESIT